MPSPLLFGSTMTPAEFKDARLKLGLSVERMAAVLHVQARNLQRWEAGDRDIPGPAIALVEILLASVEARQLAGVER